MTKFTGCVVALLFSTLVSPSTPAAGSRWSCIEKMGNQEIGPAGGGAGMTLLSRLLKDNGHIFIPILRDKTTGHLHRCIHWG